MALLASREIRTILRHEQIAQRRAARVSEAPILYEPPKRLALSVDERGGCERKQVEERLSTTDLFRFNLAAPSDASRRSLGNVNDVRVTLHPGEFKVYLGHRVGHPAKFARVYAVLTKSVSKR